MNKHMMVNNHQWDDSPHPIHLSSCNIQQIPTKDQVIFKWLGKQDYLRCWEAMKTFTNERNDDTIDEIWFLEHPPVYTQGQNGKPEHILRPAEIPIVQIDRGGQITYHGPGQLVVYTLLNIQRKKMNIRQLVSALENTIIEYLITQGINAEANLKAPGIYINNKKICSIGLRIRRGCSYHGLAFNVNVDLAPFYNINPCGYSNLEMTRLSHYNNTFNIQEVALALIEPLKKNLSYNQHQFKTPFE